MVSPGSISFKLTVPLMFIMFGAVASFLTVFYFLSNDMTMNRSQQRARELSEIVASSIERSATPLSIFGIVNSLGSYEDIEEIFLLSVSHKRIIAANKHQFKNRLISEIEKKDLQRRLLEAVNTENNMFQILERGVFSYSYQFSLVSKDKKSINNVVLHLVLNSRVINKSLNPFFNYLLLLILLLLAFTAVLFVIMVRRIVIFPLNNIIGVMAKGQDSSRALITLHHSNDEIGELANQYNRLMSALDSHQERLVLEKEKSEYSAKVKSEFLATMTHEIRTPLNGIIGMSELLNASTLNEQQSHYAKTIQSSGGQLLSIINDVLDFSKIESGKMELNLTTYDLLQAIKSSLSLFEIQCQNKGIDLSFKHDVKGEELYIEADEVRLRQVLLNLLGNAIKFTEHGQVQVKLLVINESIEFIEFELSVKDSGIGISNDQVAILFDEFTQADSSTTRDFGGTGLGLAICKKICEKMGGKISAHGEMGVGSTFKVHLTLEKKQQPIADVVDDIEECWQQSRYQLQGIKARILLVEDTDINLEIATAILEDSGFEVEAAVNGKQASEKFLLSEFDVVLMDCLMPVMDGYEATKQIRKSDIHNAKSIPILALTASALQETKDKCLNAGMNDFLSKPFDSNHVVNKIKFWLLKSERN